VSLVDLVGSAAAMSTTLAAVRTAGERLATVVATGGRPA
jgi:hypothetical protein